MSVTSRVWGSTALFGLVIGEIGGALMHFPPFLPQHFLRTAGGALTLVLLAIVTLTSLFMWARTSATSDNRAYSAAIASVGVLAFLVNVLGPALGLFGGSAFDGPVPLLAILTSLRAMAILGLLLLLYRWSEARWPWPARLVYLLILISLVPATIRADETFLASGILVFSGGYTVWHDVLVGEFFFVLPVVVHAVLRHRWPPQRNQSAA